MPWREDRTPYRVLVAEVMLQQTQVKTVIPYFKKWMKRFPSIESLALAEESEIIKLWEGLGYYSRARSLLKTAKEIKERFHGEFPSDKESLSTLSGLGPYTIGALLNFAFHKKAPLVDGNVMRVLSRFYALHEPIDTSKGQKQIWKITEEILPDKHSWIFTEALMELGATICQKKPLCQQCPLNEECEAYKQKLTDKLPFKEKKMKLTAIDRTVAIICSYEKTRPLFLVDEVKTKGLMQGLFEFPFIDEKMNEKALLTHFQSRFSLSLQLLQPLKKEKQSFTRYTVSLYPYLLITKKQNGDFLWKTKEELLLLPFSSGHRRIVNQLIHYENITQ